MKRYLLFILLGLLASCQGELNVDSDQMVDKSVHVTGITLDRKQVTLKEGATVTLVPTVYPEDATNKKVSWSSGDVAIATVEDGKVTAIKAGTTAIIAATEDGGKTAMCSVVVESNLAPAVTVGAEHISAVSVTLKGKANLGSTMSSDLKVGFQYSKSEGILPANSTTVDATEADSDYNYWTVVTGLEPGTTYYFRSFVRQNGMDTYGETKSFTMEDVRAMLETLDATSVEASQAKLNAKLDLTDVGYKTLEYGFYWGTSEDSQNSFVKGGEIADATYSVFRTGLSHKTQYWYKAYVKLDSQTFYGATKTFTTGVVPVESISLDKTAYTFNTIGGTMTLKATILPSDATNKGIEWTSDNENVATVSAVGTVRSVGNGSAVITATTVDQKKMASCIITVNQPGGDDTPAAAGTYTIDFTAQGYADQVSVKALTKNGITVDFSNAQWFDNGQSVRVYCSSTMKVSSSKRIVKIVLTFGEKDNKTDFISAAPGIYNEPTWTGNAGQVVFTVDGDSGHRRIAKLTVTLSGEDSGENPGGDTTAETLTDILNAAFTGATSNQYIDWSGKKGSASSAVYAGNSASQYEAIQLRSKNNNSGIVSTTSGGAVTKVSVVWNDESGNVGNTAARAVQVYGSNTAYSSAADLYGSKAGTLLGTITYGEGTEVSVSGNYAYVGIRSKEYALFLDKIEISWY